MIDSNAYPQWKIEYLRWIQEDQEKFPNRSSIVRANSPKPKLSDLLRCAEMAKERPEIWELAVVKARRTPEQRDAEEDYQLTEICVDFCDWFRFKYKMRDLHPAAFSGMQNVLLHWAEADSNIDKELVARHWFRPNCFVDDLGAEDTHNGIKK